MRNYPYVPSMVQAITVLTVLKMMTKAQTSCGSGSMNGKILYERLPNIQLQGFDEDIVRDTMAPFMVLEKCEDLCLKDRNSQNIVRACASFDFQPGSRIATYNGGPEYEESTCYLSPNQARPEGMGSLMIVPNSIHFNEICLTSNRPDRECPNRRYVFERHPRKRLKLPMPDMKEMQASNRSDCEDKCLDEFSFVCRSATFDANQGMCILSRFTRRTHPELLQDDPDAEYLENTCLSAERRCDGLAVFIKEENRRLGGPFEVDSYTNITLEDCQGMCVRAEKYLCRSIEYDEMTKQCTISEEDSVSQKDDISLASSPTHNFYDFACLDSPTSQQNRHQRNLKPRGSEYPDNSVTSHLFTGKKPDTAFQRYRNSRLGGEHHSEISGRSLSECLDECLRQPSFQCRSAEYSERYRTCRLTRYNQKDGMRIIYDADYDYYENLMLGGDSEGRPGGEGGTGTYRPGEYPHRPGGDYPRPGGDYPRPGGDYPRPGEDYPRPGGEYPRPGGDYPVRPGYPRPGDDYPIRPGGDYPMRPGGDYPIRPGGDYPRPGGDRPHRPGYPYDDYPPRRPPSYRPSSSGGDYDDRDRYYPKPPYSRIPPDDYSPRPLGPPRDGYPDKYPDRYPERYPDSRYPDRYPDRRPPSRDRYPYYAPSSSGDKYPVRPSGGDRYGDRDRYGGDRGRYGGDRGGYGSRYGERYPDYEYPAGGSYRPSSSGGDKYGGVGGYDHKYGGGGSGYDYKPGGGYDYKPGGGYDHKYGGGRYPDRYGDRYGDRDYGGDRYGDRFGGGNRYDYYGDEKDGGSRWFFRPDRRPVGRPVDPVPLPYDPIRPGGGGPAARPPYGGRPISPGPDGPIYDSFGGIGPNRPYSSRCDEGGNFKQIGTRQRARKEFIRKSTSAPSLVDCERECSEMRDFICRSFNYRDVPSTGYETNRENCELSDRDTRDMEINNPQYFENTGNFEYYERSISRHGVDGDCLDVSQVCNEDGMEFTLRTPEGFYGRIYTYGFYDRCFFRGNGGTVNVLRISGAQGYPECGTQRYGDSMTNIVVVQFSDYVQTGKDKRFNLTCLFRGPGEAVVSSGFIGAGSGSPIPIEYLPAENTLSSKVRLMILYQGRPTTTIAVGDPLTFRLEAQDGYNYVTDIFATNVVARDPYTGRSVQLIDRYGCPVDSFVFPELDRGRSGDSLEARFNAFKIPESNFLVFEATVRTCKDGCQPAYCPSGSGRSEPSFGRKRRSVNETLLIESTNNTIIEETTKPDENRTEDTSIVSFPPTEKTPTDDDNEKEAESPEYVREMIEVFDSREELQQEAQRAEKLPETVCLTKGEYHSLVTVLFSLLALLLTVILLVSWGYRRYWSVIKKNIIVNRSASNISTTFSSTSYPNTRSSNISGGISIFGTGFSKSFTGFGRARHFPSLPRDDSESPNPAPGGPFEDPSEPIYIDPSLFERSRSLRSIAVSPKRRTSISS